jgi:hypothetical protein
MQTKKWMESMFVQMICAGHVTAFVLTTASRTAGHVTAFVLTTASRIACHVTAFVLTTASRTVGHFTAFVLTTASRTSEYIPFSLGLECEYVLAMHELESHLFYNEVSLA